MSPKDFPHPLPGRAAAHRRPHPLAAAPAARSGGPRLQKHQPGRQQGRPGRRAGQRRQRKRAGRDAEKARHHRQRGADRGQRMGRPPGRPWPARKWKASTWCPTATRRANTCCCSTRWTAPATSTSTSASAPSSACCKMPEGDRGVDEADFLQAGAPAGGRRLLRLRPADHAGADRGRRRGHVHAGPRAGLLRADRRRTCRSRPTPRNSPST